MVVWDVTPYNLVDRFYKSFLSAALAQNRRSAVQVKATVLLGTAFEPNHAASQLWKSYINLLAPELFF